MARDFDSFLRPMPSGCIEWTGVTVKSNSSEAHRYGRYTSGGKKRLAHRVAYERAFGEIPEDMLVLHRCDNTKCCNPDHLFLGTHLDNMAHKVRQLFVEFNLLLILFQLLFQGL